MTVQTPLATGMPVNEPRDTILDDNNLTGTAEITSDIEKSNLPSQIPPEGGTQGWLCVLGAFLSIFCTFGFLNAWVSPQAF
tara:strand:- start:1597 stop:1839 length:243 start_codon:yes stop_codon:yes gene_type:complete